MKVINREAGNFNGRRYVTYIFDTGHEFRQWSHGTYFAYTKTHRYTSIPTMNKMIKLVSEYEDTRIQMN